MALPFFCLPTVLTARYDMGGQKMTYRTGAGSLGMGSNSAGMLMSGTTYSVVFSGLLQAAGHAGMFTG